MKRLIKELAIAICFMPFASQAQDVNLDMMPQKQRDSLLFVVSERAIKFYGPVFFRKNTPNIERITEDNKEYIFMTYPSDDNEKHMIGDYAARIWINPQTGQVSWVQIGSQIMIRDASGYDFLNNPPVGTYMHPARYPDKPLRYQSIGGPTIPLPDEALEETRQQNIQDRKEYEARLENWRKIREEINRRWAEVDEQLKEKYPDKDVRAGKVTQEVNRQIAAGKLPLAKKELDKRAKEDEEREKRKLERQKQLEEFERRNRRE